MEKEKKKQSAFITERKWIIAAIIAWVLIAVGALVFTLALVGLDVLPAKYLAAVLIVVWVLTLLVAFLQYVQKMRWVSKVLAVLLVAVLAVGIYLLSSITSLLETASDVTVSTDYIYVYVLNDDPAESIEDAADYEFGILEALDRDNTDAALAALEEELGSSVSVTEYTSMLDLAAAMRDGEIGAMLVNGAYLATVDEDEDYEDFPDEVRYIWSFDVTRELEITEEEEEVVTTEEGDLSPFILYISGNDASGTLKSTGRSDVNILMVVNPSTHKILLVNTPRDYYVVLSNVGQYDKLTHAGIYGVDVSMNTLANLYGVSISRYARMNFTGFTEIIDALGGITVYSEYAFTSRGYTFTEGYNTMDGAAALVFARERYSFSSGDRQRGKNQMAVIEAVIEKCLSSAILTSYTDIINAASGSFETNMTQDEISALVKYQLSYGGDWEVETISADGSGARSSVYSAQSSSLYVMVPYESSVAEVKEAIEATLAGE